MRSRERAAYGRMCCVREHCERLWLENMVCACFFATPNWKFRAFTFRFRLILICQIGISEFLCVFGFAPFHASIQFAFYWKRIADTPDAQFQRTRNKRKRTRNRREIDESIIVPTRSGKCKRQTHTAHIYAGWWGGEAGIERRCWCVRLFYLIN